jgi:hypothetical protein
LWYASKKLYSGIREINYKIYRKKNNTHFVELAPLLASAQFLNVIELIFSGMARAIIHNSNYQSKMNVNWLLTYTLKSEMNIL